MRSSALGLARGKRTQRKPGLPRRTTPPTQPRGATWASAANAGAWVRIEAMRPAKNPAKREKASDQAMSAQRDLLRLTGENRSRKGRKASEHAVLAMAGAAGKKALCVETGEACRPIPEAGRQLGISSKAVSKACRGKPRASGGCHWEHVEEPR